MPWIGPSIFADAGRDRPVTKRRLAVGDEVFIPLAGGRLERATVTEVTDRWQVKAESEHCVFNLHFDDTPSMGGETRARWHCDHGEHKGSGIPVLGPR